MNRKLYSVFVLLVALVAVAFIVSAMSACQQPQQVTSQGVGYNVPVRFELGGKKFVVANGGTLEVQSGGKVDMQNGSAITVSGLAMGTADLTGRAITLTGALAASSGVITNGLQVKYITATNSISSAGSLGVGATLSGVDAALTNGAQARYITATGTISSAGNVGVGATLTGMDATFGNGLQARYITATGTISGDLMSGLAYPVLYSADKYQLYVGTVTLTGTQSYTTSTHGFTTVRWAECQLTSTPGAGITPFICEPSWTTTNVTFTNYTITPAVASEVGRAVTYAILGTP